MVASYRAMVGPSGVPLIHLVSTGAEHSLCGLPLATLGGRTICFGYQYPFSTQPHCVVACR